MNNKTTELAAINAGHATGALLYGGDSIASSWRNGNLPGWLAFWMMIVLFAYFVISWFIYAIARQKK